ncbi:MAG: hypothetical protein M0P69_01635 [Bacteroidales bacterium]|nr:hypothetical protein [Bacteroidales bacterium]
MKKGLIVMVVCLVCFSMSGCLVVGNGRIVGYITGVEDSLVWSKVYFKTELASSDTDTFAVNKYNKQLKETLYQYAKTRERVEVGYRQHSLMATMDTDAEIISVTKS